MPRPIPHPAVEWIYVADRGAKLIVRVFEEPAGGKDALKWILLTDLPVDTFEQAFEVARMYSYRWLVEEFHKALKSGMGA